ncbi:MAG: PocR ligand-binding domain-containing protein [Candidatus Omnitrophota bacterium]
MLYKDLNLADLVSLEDWQKIQDQFSEALEVTLRTVSPEGKYLSETSRSNRLCTEILSKINNEQENCGNCLIGKDDTLTALDIKKTTSFKCSLGLDVFVVPITAVGNKIVAYIILGPIILKSRKSISEYTEDAQKIGIKLEELMDALIEINVFSYNKIQTIINLIKDTTSYMAQTGYHKKRLGEIAPEVVELDPIFSRYYEEKILSSLLDSCTLALGADSGSVMTIDKTNRLHIKVASKLDKNIVKQTTMRMGEGIAGIAAQTAQAIILPKDEDKNNLSQKMKRRDIQSSMIVPFTKGDAHEVYGVINLNIARKDVDFSEKDISLVKELVHMASIALFPLHKQIAPAKP